MRRLFMIACVVSAIAQAAFATPVSADSYRVVTSFMYNRGVACGSLGRCTIRLDAYVPAHPIKGAVVLLLHGGPAGLGARSGMAKLAEALAARRVLTYSADYRDLASQGASYANTMADVACASAAVRRYSPMFGGLATHVILVGFSLGGWIAAAGTMRSALPGPCASAPGAHPDIFYGLSGSYDIWSRQRLSDMVRFFGSKARIDPRLDTLAMARRSHRKVTYHVIAERNDPTVNSSAAVRFRSYLLASGDRVRYTMFGGSSHSAPADPRTSVGAAVVRMIVATALDPDQD
jgi:acetyl esterase/lipase